MSTDRASAFTLYGTSACHLCELAEAQLMALAEAGLHLDCEKVDISEDDRLMDLYGVSIPVLRRNRDGSELNWPFQPQDILDLIE